MTDPDPDELADDPEHEHEEEDEDEDELPSFRPPRQVSPNQALLAVVLLCVVCIAIGFVLGRTL